MAKDKTLGGLMPFGFQRTPGEGRGDGFSSMFYSMGVPGLYNGRWTSIYQDQFNNALYHGKDPNSIMPWGTQAAQSQQPALVQQPAPQMNWSFPQYASTWAFTPPTPIPYTLPPPNTFKAK